MNPICPYCPDGVEMTLRLTECSDGTIAAAYYECPVCEADSPYIEDHIADDIRAAAYEAAMKRYVEPNRVLSAEEVRHAWELCKDDLETVPMWYETKDGHINRWVLTHRYALSENNMASYGIGRRCWLRRPTDAERSAAKWGDAECLD